MTNHYDTYVVNLYKFIVDLDRYYSTNGTREFLEKYEQLNMNKVILRFISNTREFKEQIKQKDETIFTDQFKPFPGIDFSEIWPKLTDGQKKKSWIYINILYHLAETIIENKEREPQIQQDQAITSSFNPYIGIGEDNPNYGIDELFSGPKDLPISEEDKNKSQLGIGSLLGMDKMLDINGIKQQLGNMTQDDINTATDNIQNIIGTDNDPNTKNLITNILTNLKDEIKNSESTGKPMEDMMKIVNSIGSKMQPEIQNSNVDMDKLFKGASKMTGVNMNPMEVMKMMSTGKGLPTEYKAMMNMMGISMNDFKDLDEKKMGNIMSKMSDKNNKNKKNNKKK